MNRLPPFPIVLSLALVSLFTIGAPAAADAPKATAVKVLDAGAGKKTALRYAFKKGAKEKVTVESDMTMSMKMGTQTSPAMAMPTVTQALRVEVLDVGADGVAKYQATLETSKIVGKADPKMGAALSKELEAVKGTVFVGTLSNQGVHGEVDVKLGPSATAQTRELVDGVISGLQQLLPLLPQEEVGAGAKWTVESPVTLKFGTVKQSATYELKSVKGDTIQLASTLEQSAAGQSLALPGLPPGQEAKLISLKGKGSSSVALKLSRLDPTGTVQADVNMVLGAQGQNLEMAMTTAMRAK